MGLAIGIGLGLALTAGVIVYLVSNPEDPAGEAARSGAEAARRRVARAVGAANRRAGCKTRVIRIRLWAGGGVPFVLGICAFRDAGAHET